MIIHPANSTIKRPQHRDKEYPDEVGLLLSEKNDLRDASTLFSNVEVHAARAWKYGRSADHAFIESVWPLLDEYRAYVARKSFEAKP